MPRETTDRSSLRGPMAVSVRRSCSCGKPSALAQEASGDEGLRSILTDHPQLVTPVDVAAHPPDVDTPADLGTLA